MVRRRARSLRRTAASSLLCLFLSLLCSCGYGVGQIFGRGDTVSSRSLEASNRDAAIAAQKALLQNALPPGTAFSFIVASDLHFSQAKGPRAAALEGFTRLAAESGADFALFGGDYADKGLEEEYKLFLSFAAALKAGSSSHLGEGAALPWFSVVGNHDLYNSGWKYYKKLLGPSSDSFSAGSLRFYCIDTGSGTVGEEQLESLGSAMSADPSPKVVLSHYPVHGARTYSYFRLTNTRERAELLSMFNERGVELLLCGHWHRADEVDCGHFPEYLTGSLVDAKPDGLARAVVVRVAADGSIASLERSTF
jgi:predicted phosphodiesterase